MDSDLRLRVPPLKVNTILIESLEIVRATHVFELSEPHLALNRPEIEEHIVIDRVCLPERMVGVLVDTEDLPPWLVLRVSSRDTKLLPQVPVTDHKVVDTLVQPHIDCDVLVCV